MKSIVVIPTYNEAENIPPLVEAIQAAMPGLDILVVDDGSPDGTGAIAEAIDGVEVLHRSGKFGLGTAYVAGYKRCLDAGYDRIGGMDADFSHDPNVLPVLFGLLDDHDIGIGSRYVPGGGTRNWGVQRQLLSRGANTFARTVLGLDAKDVTAGFRCYRREVLESIDLDNLESAGYAFLVELLFRAAKRGYTVVETPIIFEERRLGQSKMSTTEIWGGVKNVFRLRFGG